MDTKESKAICNNCQHFEEINPEVADGHCMVRRGILTIYPVSKDHTCEDHEGPEQPKDRDGHITVSKRFFYKLRDERDALSIRAAELEGMLREVYSQCGNHAPADRRHALTPAIRDRIRDQVVNRSQEAS